MKQIIVIPARMNSSRMPGKPLKTILGKTVLYRVWERCNRVHPRDDIYVATEDQKIKEYCLDKNINCVNTGEANTAIDRIQIFSDVVEADSYINVQGDEPVVNTDDIKTILEYNRKWPERVVFGKCKASREEFIDYSKAKVVCDLEGRLLYSSRAGIPLNNKGKYESAERAIWIYAFNRNALVRYHQTEDITKLDKIEDNEIIRFLEIGLPVYCVDVKGDSWAVDEPKDIGIVEKIIKDRSLD